MISKIKGKIFLFLLLFLFGITNVNAATKNIEVKDISVKDKSGTITVVDPVLVSNEVTSNITFNQIDDFVTFELTLKNNESEKYKVISVTDNNDNENIKTEYSFSEDYMNTGDESKVTIKLTYKNKLLNVDQISLNNLTIKISLANEDGKEEEIIINPTTGDNIFHYLVLLIIALTGLILIAKRKKIKGIKIGNLLLIFTIIMIPFAAIAKEQYEINIKFNDIIVKGEFETYSITIDPNNGDAPTVKDITYGQKIGDLPANPSKDGYTFDKWVDAEGNEITKDTVINGPIEVIATYNLVTYNISYDLDDGSLPSGKSNPTEYTIESQSITLNNPEKRGYTFAGWSGTGIDGQSTEVTIDHGSKGDRSYKAYYLAKDDTKYTVIHKFQKLSDLTQYDEETVVEHGTTGSTVPAPRKTRTGFVTPTVQNVTIAADESASVTYVYDRETYAFSITDRTYVDSTSTADGTYPYGTEISVKANERPGYGFAWSDGNTEYERTFELSEETNLTPEYTADTNTPYTVKHYKMDLDGVNYTIADTQNLSGTTDSPISPAVNTYEGFTSPAVQSTTIGGDGHTVVDYYYTRNQVTVTFTNTEYIEEEVTTGEHYYGEQITLTAKERDGYTFTGWTTGETNNPLTVTVGTSDVSVGPEYTANTNTPYTVKHMKQKIDGEYELADTDNETGTTDTSITPAVKTYEGFTSPSTQTTTISGKGDTVVTYNYTRNKYTLTINHPEYLEEDKSGEYYYGEEITLTAIDRQGYTFAGWNTGETTKTITVSIPVDGITEEATYTSNTDTTYKVTHKYKKLTEGYDEVTINGTGTTGETIPAPLRPSTGFINPTVQNITITADGQASVTYIYEREEYAFSITDRSNLDSTSTANGTYPYGTEITLKAQEREGYTFKWSDNVTDLERTFELTEATTLSLVYTADTYTLTADANEGTIEETTGWTGTGATATKTITYDSTYGTLPTVKRTGYTFTGWTSIISGIEVNINEDTTVFTTTDQTITANWSINSYTVTFDVDGGSEVPSQTINYGGKVTKPANPTKENFAFAGWYEDDTLTTPFDFENTTIDKTTTIYAKWSSCNGFATASWNTIVSNLESDSSYYPVGCQKWVQVGSVSYKARLANTSTPAVCNTPGYSQTACGNVIEFIHVIDARQMKSNGKNAGGWKETGMVNYLNTDFYNSLASDLKAVLIPTYPIVSGSGNDNNSANITNEDTNLNKIYYLSAKEVGFDLDKDNKKNDTRTLDYYETNNTDNDRKKTTINNIATDWWLRTASSTNDSGYFRVESEGTTDSYNAAGTGGNTPAFRIGRMPEFTVTFNTDEGSEIASQTVSYGSTATRPGDNPTKSGFIFDDWYTDDTLTTKYDFTTPITGDTTIYARYNDGCYNFRTDSWSTISSNIETDPGYYPLGCTKEVEMDMNDDNTPESYTVRLSNTSTPEVCNTEGYSQTSCGTVVEFIDIPVYKSMNSDNINTGGWKETELITYLNGDFYNKLPSDLKSIIIPTYPIVSGSGSGLDSDNITKADTTINKLYLLSGKEVGYILTYDNKKDMETDTRILDYYFANYNNAARVKTNISGEEDNWWLRSAASNSTLGFFSVADTGISNVNAATESHGVAPAFRIGKNTYTVEFNANGGTVTNPTKEVIKGEEIGTLPTPTPATGKIFDKWYTGIDSGVEVTSTYQVNNDITIYARYTNQEFTVSFDTDGGSTVPSQTVSYGSTATRPTTEPTKTRSTFDDWYTTDEFTTKFDFTTPITGDTTIYAKFDELKVCADNTNITRLSENTCSNNENIIVGDGIVCKRAVKLHEETCSQTDGTYYCSGAGYTTSGSKGTSTITYGSCGTSGTLTSGDAFTCDVNGDEKFDELTERFYYVSDYYDTSAKEFDDSTAVLIYYNNVASGVSCNRTAYAYDSEDTNYNGPRTLVSQLPTTSKWSNVELKNTTRQILTETGTTSTSGGTLPEFDYSGYAARLLIYQEIQSACGSTGMTSKGYLDSCNYLMENTKYSSSSSSSSIVVYGHWLETPDMSRSNSVWYVYGDYRRVTNYGLTYQNNTVDSFYLGARPAIEVPKSKIEYGASSVYKVTLNPNGGTVTPTSITVNAGSQIGELPTPAAPEGKEFAGWYTELTGGIEVTSTYIPNVDIEIYAKYNDIDSCNGFSTDSWSTIKANLENNSSYYAVGCTKEVPIDMDNDGVDESYTVRLANTSTPEVCSTEGYSQTACGTVIEFVDIVALRQLTSTRTNDGGWKATPLVTWVNSDLYDKLHSDLKSVIIPTYPIVSGSGSGGNSPDITSTDTTINKLYLLSGREVGFDLSYDNKKDVTTDTRTLDYYLTIEKNSQRIKYDLGGEIRRWWLRTPYSGHDARFYGIYETGTYGFDYGTDNSTGVAPAFRIGTEVSSKYTVTFDTDGGSTVPSQTINSGGTVTRPTTDPTKTGYVFDDWYTTDQYTTKFDFENTAITEDTTIYAKFDELKTCADNENITRLSENTCSNNENITVGDGIVCKRAVKLHEETCSQTDGTYYCSGAGYSESGSKGTSTITYGSCGSSGTLSSGDAFTCDVNGDGDFDELTERFYYVSDYYDTSAKEFDDSTAVLIYYNNVTSGVSCNYNRYAYDSSNENWHGPRTLVSQLPTTSQWSNVSLKSDTRAILAENQSTHDSPTTAGGTLPTDFSYEGYAARLLTAKELMSGCNLTEVGGKTTGELDSCNYIMENTRYAKSTIGNSGTWVETPYAFDSDTVWYVGGHYRSVRSSSTNNTNFGGARPAIEVPKSAIAIGNLPQYTVSFNSDGGSAIADIEVDAGDSINELPTPTKVDSVFVGWFESVTDENPVTEPYTPSGDITLIAKWNNIICKKATTLLTETCNSANGKGCKANGYSAGDVISYGNVITSDTLTPGDALDCDVDGTGYNQRFYYVTNNSDNAVLISYTTFSGEQGQSNIDVYYNYDTSLTLLPTTAQWSNLPVKFEIQSGDYRPARMIRLEELEEMTGLSYSELKTDGALNDYDFLFENSLYSGIGQRSTVWLEQTNIDGNDTRIRYRNDTRKLDEVTSDKYNTSNNCIKPIIEVPFDLIEDAYIVKFDANGGTSTSEYSKVIKGNSLGTLPTATREGYIFDGWYTSLEFTTEVTENTIPNGYVTYYAKWTGDISDASFAYSSFILSVGDEDDIVINNSSDYESVTYTSNDTSIVTVNNSGHLTAVDDGETTITVTGSRSGHTRTINVKVTEEITEFVVHFDSMGGSSVNDMNVPKNTAIGSLPEDPILADNIFAGWYTNTNYSTKVTTDTVIRSDVTFYAKWIPENAVAEINHSYFTSLQDAFDSEMTGKTTIILLKDISVNNTYLNLYTKNLGKDIVLDLNNKTITGTGSQTIKTKTSLEIKNGTITQSSSNGTIDIGSGGHLIINSGTVINTGSRAAIYNDGGTVELGGTVNITSNAEWAGNNNRGTVQNKSGTTIITGGTYINTRSSNSYAVSATVGTLTIGTKDDIYNTSNIVIQGETGGIYSAVNYSLYDGMIKGITAAVENESKITSIEDNATKVNDVDGSYNILYYTVPNNKYRIDLDAGEGTVNPTYILIDAGDQIGTLPTPTRGVYTFDGWFDSNDVEADPTHQPTSSETYYAKWHYEASNEIVEFRTTNDAMAEYYDKIDTWKVSSSNFPSWSSSNNSPNWALDATENTPMKNNFDANNCQCADGQCSSSGTVACDKPKGYSTGLSEKVNVYLSDAVTKAKGDLVTYAKSNNGVIYNLIPGQVYYWEAESDENVHGYVKFTGERRILDTGDVRNTRDLGGLPVDTDSDGTIDGELKYGKLFRGIKLNSASSVTELVNLGVTEEFDLRESNSDPYKLSDVSGKKYHRIEAQNYYVNYNPDNATEMGYYNMTRAAVKYAMEEIVNGENIYFHCRIGTDRTGTVAYVLEGLLGVPEEDRIQDYELSFFYGLIRIHRYHNEKPGSSVGTGKERFVYMHNFMPTNSDIYDWYMAGSTNVSEDQALINSFRTKMINSY